MEQLMAIHLTSLQLLPHEEANLEIKQIFLPVACPDMRSTEWIPQQKVIALVLWILKLMKDNTITMARVLNVQDTCQGVVNSGHADTAKAGQKAPVIAIVCVALGFPQC